MESKNNNSKIYKILKIVGIIMVVVAIVMFIIGISDFFSSFNSNLTAGSVSDVKMPTKFFYCFIAGPILFVGIVLIVIGNNKGKFVSSARKSLDDLKDLESSLNTQKTEVKTKYCIYCGSPLDENAKRCNNCGASQK